MTNRQYVELTVQAEGMPQDVFEGIVDRAADHLVNARGVIDPDLGADSSTREITFCMTVEASGVDATTNRALAVVRSVLHAAGGETHGWDSLKITIPAQSETKQLLTL